MGLSRRMFTKEFKLAAVQRLERGSSIGEVARALSRRPRLRGQAPWSAARAYRGLRRSAVLAAIG